MRIGVDARLWNESGVGRYIRNLVEQLLIIDRKNNYTLFVLSKDIENIKYQISNIKKNWKLEIGNWKLSVADTRWHTIEEQLQFPSILNKEDLDLVHFPYFSVPIFYNRPFVVTIHDLILHHFPTGEASTLPRYLYNLKLIGYKFIISSAAKRAKKIITVSNSTKSEVVDHLGVSPHKVVVTHEGVFSNSKLSPRGEAAGWPASPSASSRRDGSLGGRSGQLKTQKHFLYIGNAYPHKNLERLLEAFSKIRIDTNDYFESTRMKKDSDIFGEKIRNNSDLQLVLVGKEDYFYKRLKEKVRNMGLEKSVLFYGEVSDEELSALYKNALALVIPSLMEGFGLPALEAMANKCLVLASDIPALREVCVDAAIYFNPSKTEEIAQKMTSVLHSNDTYHYSDKIKKGFRKARMFSWEKMARETLTVYENCL